MVSCGPIRTNIASSPLREFGLLLYPNKPKPTREGGNFPRTMTPDEEMEMQGIKTVRKFSMSLSVVAHSVDHKYPKYRESKKCITPKLHYIILRNYHISTATATNRKNPTIKQQNIFKLTEHHKKQREK